jgi:hypothetical protein
MVTVYVLKGKVSWLRLMSIIWTASSDAVARKIGKIEQVDATSRSPLSLSAHWQFSVRKLSWVTVVTVAAASHWHGCQSSGPGPGPGSTRRGGRRLTAPDSDRARWPTVAAAAAPGVQVTPLADGPSRS